MSKSAPQTAFDRLTNAIHGGRTPDPKMPATVTGPLGTVPGAGIDTDAPLPEPRRLSQSQVQNLMQAEMLAAVRSLVESTTELAGRLGRRGAVNGVLESWAGVIPPSGVIFRTYEVAAGSIALDNCSAVVDGTHLMIVATGVPAGDTGGQASGVGVTYARANARTLAPLGDHSFTITGVAGDKVSFEVWTGIQPYGVGTL